MFRPEPSANSIIAGLSDKNPKKHTWLDQEIQQYLSKSVKEDLHCDVELLLHKVDSTMIKSRIPHMRKSGLNGVCTITSQLGKGISKFLETLVPAILGCFTDKDAEVRVAACRTMYVVVRTSGEDVLKFSKPIFASVAVLAGDDTIDCTNAYTLNEELMDIIIQSDGRAEQEFISVIHDHLYPAGAAQKSCVITWIRTLADVSTVSFLKNFPSWIDGILFIYASRDVAVQQSIKSLIGYFVNKLQNNTDKMHLNKMFDSLVSHTSSTDMQVRGVVLDLIRTLLTIYGRHAILFTPSLLDGAMNNLKKERNNESVSATAICINEKLMHLFSDRYADDSPNFGVDMNRMEWETLANILAKWLEYSEERVVGLALKWVDELLNNFYPQFYKYSTAFVSPLRLILCTESDSIAQLGLDVFCKMSFLQHQEAGKYSEHFQSLIECLVSILAEDGCRKIASAQNKVISRICSRLDPIDIYSNMAVVLTNGYGAAVISVMVRHLTRTLLRDKATQPLRQFLIKKQYKSKPQVFTQIYNCWVHNPVATVLLCFLSGHYYLAARIIFLFHHIEPDTDLLMQLDDAITLIESANFTFFRLRLLDPKVGPFIKKALDGMLMIIPQTEAYNVLRKRIKPLNTEYWSLSPRSTFYDEAGSDPDNKRLLSKFCEVQKIEISLDDQH